MHGNGLPPPPIAQHARNGEEWKQCSPKLNRKVDVIDNNG